MDHDASRAPSEPTGQTEVEQRASLAERGRGLYDRWATNQSLYGLIARANAHGRERAYDHLELSGGERVLEIGCGPGVNFEMLTDGVGPQGTVVGVDYSAEMVQRATARKDKHGWKNVEVTRGDITHTTFGVGMFDAAFASLVLSTVPTPRDAIKSVYGALKPGGRFVVFDATARYYDGAMRLLNPLRTRFVSYAFNHQQQDVVKELRAVFNRVRVAETFRAKSEYVAVAVKQSNDVREFS